MRFYNSKSRVTKIELKYLESNYVPFMIISSHLDTYEDNIKSSTNEALIKP